MSAENDKNEPSRFLGEGVSFKAKLIGILEVSEARGDRMCQDALADLKMAIRAAGEHKQRININIAIDGLRLRDEKTGDSLYHHPVHKISFIAQDMTDSRAFGYIFGSPDTGHRFFGIKTDKAASQVVIAMRDLFQVVFELKKKEIEVAKQHIEQKSRLGTNTSSSLFSDTAVSSTKSYQNGDATHSSKMSSINESSTSKSGGAAEASSRTGAASEAIADLVDLELELSSIQQGIHQMERITPSDPFGPNKDDPFNTDPFGDSFTSFPQKPFLPPPPASTRERHSRTASDTSSLFSPKTPKSAPPVDTASQETDPFAEGDPFDKTDPFAEADFTKAIDPFDTDFVEDFKMFGKQDDKQTNRHDAPPEPDKYKFPAQTDKLTPLFPSPLSKSPNRSSLFEKQSPVPGHSVAKGPGSLLASKQGPYDDKRPGQSKLSQLHENPSLDMSSESECAPEPPPRPASNITPIKPPPLPPKKQPGDLSVKPPPRPPHTEDSHYDYMDSYETAPNSLESFENFEQTPPLPVPARKSRFDSSDFIVAPQRPKKQFQGQASDEDYLMPISPTLLQAQKRDAAAKPAPKDAGPVLLPPPAKKDSKRAQALHNQVTVASLLESKPKVVSTMATDKFNLTPDTLDITLSQLTLSGLNQLAGKLNIPASQLSNMTLVQLTNYLSNYFKTSGSAGPALPDKPDDPTFPTFKADFSANFNDLNNGAAKTEPYDRYAVFRELLQQEEMKQTDEPEPPDQAMPETPPANITKDENESVENVDFKSVFQESDSQDRYAALREIIIQDNEPEQKESNLESVLEEVNDTEEHSIEKEQNDLNVESVRSDLEGGDKLNREVESNIIEYSNTIELGKDKLKPASSPLKSPSPKPENTIKSPVPIAITEIVQTNSHLTSGSLSDVVSGSSPEVDNVTAEVKNVENAARESWAIFDKPNIREETKEKQVQSEEGVSPWSSDSKEFGNGSPSDWQHRRDSGSEGDWGRRRRDRDGSWWDNQGEIEGHYEKHRPYTRERRSTDSYDDDWYEPDRPRRRTRQPTWNKGQGGQSSSSRDVSPWEEEEPRVRRNEECWPCRRRGPSWERERHRRHDSWDEDDDYDYEDEYVHKIHWPERHFPRESDRTSRESERHGVQRDDDRGHWENLGDQWSEERRHNRRKAHPIEDRWCRPDWDHENDTVCGTKEKSGRYSGARWTNPEGKWRGERERKREPDRYCKRDHSQESPWEDEYSNDPDEPHSPRYLSARRNWKRPASASETDRKTGEIKSRQQYYIGTGGSDGERDRRYKSNRRSRSKDSQFPDMSQHRHKPDPGLTLRYPHRNRDKYSQKFENDFSPQDIMPKSKLETKSDGNKKSQTLGRKKTKDSPSPKTENDTILTKVNRKQHLMFENDFVNSENDSPVGPKAKFSFENDFETSEAESPVIRHKPRQPCSFDAETSGQLKRNIKPKIGFENDFGKETKTSRIKNELYKREPVAKSVSPTVQMNVKQKSLFEDDFSPTEKLSDHNEDNGITVIAEEGVVEQKVSFSENNLDRTVNEPRKNKHILSKSRMANNIRVTDINLKKSESVNIFARENDPFDDDFFSGKDSAEVQKVETSKSSPLNVVTEFQWTEDFDSFDIPEEK